LYQTIVAMNFDETTNTFSASGQDSLKPELNYLSRNKRSPRLPWKRGPAAWEIAKRSDEILQSLANCSSCFHGLRRAAKILGVSTQPLRNWIKSGYIKRDGPRLQLAKDELCRFVKWLGEHAVPFGPYDYLQRIYRRRAHPVFAFYKLCSAHFVWPKGRKALSPRELSKLVYCHPSLVLMAIREGRVRARRRTPCRSEITKQAWLQAFPLTIDSTPRLPPLPPGDPISTADVADYLSSCGLVETQQFHVRQMIREGKLRVVCATPAGRKLFVTKASLKFLCKSLEHFNKNCSRMR